MTLVVAASLGLAIVAIVAIAVGETERALVFPRRRTRLDEEAERSLALAHSGETVEILASDGVRLRGLFLPPLPAQAPASPLVLYLGGNGELLARRAPELLPLRRAGFAVAHLAYRGYGRSEGRPTAALLARDAVEVLDALAARADVDSTGLFACGRSLGAGIAAQLAAARPLCGVVLVAPFTRLSDIAAARYPLLPVHLCLRHELDSLAAAAAARCPALILHGAADTVIPPAHADALARAWAAGAEVLHFIGRDHSDVTADPGFAPSLLAFLEGATARSSARAPSSSRRGAG